MDIKFRFHFYDVNAVEVNLCLSFSLAYPSDKNKDVRCNCIGILLCGKRKVYNKSLLSKLASKGISQKEVLGKVRMSEDLFLGCL